MVEVFLHRYEKALADGLGTIRHHDNRGEEFGGYPDRNGKRLMMDKVAARCELAVAKHYGLYWSGIAKMERDVGFKWEVRSVAVPHYGLILREKDEDVPHILAYTELDRPDVRIIGWFQPREVRPEHFQDGSPQDDSPFHLVPQQDLIPCLGPRAMGNQGLTREAGKTAA